MEEVRKTVPWYDRYLVSNLWNVKTIWFCWWHEERLLKQKDRKWYLICYLSKNWKHSTITVSRLVAMAFLSNPEMKRTVNHKDWNRHNNKLENLEWATDAENVQHRFNVLWHKWTFLGKFWYEHNCSKEVIQYDKQWNELKRYWSIKEAERKTWVCCVNISWCCRNKYWYKTAWWFIWKFS